MAGHCTPPFFYCQPMSDIIKESAAFFENEFQLRPAKEALNEASLITWLTPVVKMMLDRDFGKLLAICYRIDLGEEKLKKILHESAPDNVAKDLTEALVIRQLQKLAMRQKYREG